MSYVTFDTKNESFFWLCLHRIFCCNFIRNFLICGKPQTCERNGMDGGVCTSDIWRKKRRGSHLLQLRAMWLVDRWRLSYPNHIQPSKNKRDSHSATSTVTDTERPCGSMPSSDIFTNPPMTTASNVSDAPHLFDTDTACTSVYDELSTHCWAMHLHLFFTFFKIKLKFVDHE